MIITAKRTDLLESLNKVRPTVANASNKLTQLFGCFCFREDTVAGYNGQAGTLTSCPMDKANFAVDADKFYRIIAALSDDVELKLDMEGMKIHIKSKSYKSWLSIFDTAAFPDIIPPTYDRYSDADNLLTALVKAVATVGHNVLKPELLGLTLNEDYIYTSDSFRISRIKLSKSVFTSIGLPAFTVEHLAKLGQPDYTFYGGGLFGAFYGKTSTIYISRTLEAKFPAKHVDNMIKAFKGEIVEFPKELAGIVNRVQIAAADNINDVIVESTGEELVVRTPTTQVGHGIEKLTWACPFKFGFSINSAFLMNALSKTHKCDVSDLAKYKLAFIADDAVYIVSTVMNYEAA